MSFEADRNPHAPSFHFENKNGERVDDVEYSVTYSSDSSGYNSTEPPTLIEDYSAVIDIKNSDKYIIDGNPWLPFKIVPPKEGYNNLKDKFEAQTRVWGTDGNNGVDANNVTDKQDRFELKVDGANRKGAALKSNDFYDEGSFEFVASTNSKNGVCMAFWTFFYAEDGAVNNEIDFELFGRNKIIYSTYTSENIENQTHNNSKVDFDVSENKIHTYRFDWHKGKSVTFYIDNIEVSHITEHIPDQPMEVWIGAWCPSWAVDSESSDPTNVESMMTIYSFTYHQGFDN